MTSRTNTMVASAGLALSLALLSRAAQADETQAAAALYQQNCAACHGPQGEGIAIFPALADVGSRLAAEDVAEILEHGRNQMPSFDHLADEERAALVEYLISGMGVEKQD